MKRPTPLIAAAATVAQSSCNKEREEQKNQPAFVSPTKTTFAAHVSALFLGSVSSGSAQKIHLFSSHRLSPISIFFSRISLSPLSPSLSILRPADYYATATITFPRRHPLSWLFASLRSTRRNYLANPLKERKRRETWGRPSVGISVFIVPESSSRSAPGLQTWINNVFARKIFPLIKYSIRL